MAQKPNPVDIIRSKDYVALLVVAGILGVPIAIFAYFFLYFVSLVQDWIYVDLPGQFNSNLLATWWPIIPLTIAGLIVGFAVSKMPGKGGELPLDGLKMGKETDSSSTYLWSVALAAIVSIGFGAVIGPEAPLIALGGGLAFFLFKFLKKNAKKQAKNLVSASGSFAAISTLLGSPLTGAFLLMEAAGLGGLMMEVALIPGLLAAGVGYLIFVGLDALTGLGTFSLVVPNLPEYANPQISEFLWAVVIGLTAPFVILAIRQVGQRYHVRLKRNIIAYTAVGGLTVGILAVLFTQITDHTYSFILSSGQDQLPELISSGASLSILTLLLILLFKGLAYGISLASFRGGPTFPAMFLGAVIGILISNVTGLALIAGVGIGISAMTASMLRLPLTSVLLTVVFLGGDGVKLMPLIIVAVVVSYVFSIRLTIINQPAET